MDHIAIHLTMECTTKYSLLRTQPLCVSYCSVDRLFSWSWLSRVINWLFIFCFSGCVNSFGILSVTEAKTWPRRPLQVNRVARFHSIHDWREDTDIETNRTRSCYSLVGHLTQPAHLDSWMTVLSSTRQNKTRQHKTKLDDSKEIFLPSLHHCIV